MSESDASKKKLPSSIVFLTQAQARTLFLKLDEHALQEAKEAKRYQKVHPLLSLLPRWRRWWFWHRMAWRDWVCPVLVSNIIRTADFWPRLWREMFCAYCGRYVGWDRAFFAEWLYLQHRPPKGRLTTRAPQNCGCVRDFFCSPPPPVN
jgi:hypothetical protein